MTLEELNKYIQGIINTAPNHGWKDTPVTFLLGFQELEVIDIGHKQGRAIGRVYFKLSKKDGE